MVAGSKTLISENQVDYSYNTSKTCPINESKKIKQSFETEEWLEILQMTNITAAEMDKFAKNKTISKIIEAIELLNKLLLGKNLQIRLFESENNELMIKNDELNKDNMKLLKKCEELESRIKEFNIRRLSDNKIKMINMNKNESDLNSVILIIIRIITL